MDDLRLPFTHILDGEADRALDAVEVVVDARTGQHDHRRRHAQERELGRQVVLEHVLDRLDGFFGRFRIAEQVAVALGDEYTHDR